MKFYVVVALVGMMTILDASASDIPEVEHLLDQMTVEEKIGQLNLLTPGGGVATGSVVSDGVEAKIKAGQVGGLFGVVGPDKVRAAQKIAVEESRLGIPLLIGADVIHGYKTTFPIPLGAACTWDLERIENAARIAAKESTADGINWNFSPMVDIARDPRWGRIAEGAGEDPYLGSQIASAMVKGYQGSDLLQPDTLMACVKHLALYGAAEAGRDYNSVDMSRVKMFNDYLPPYKAAVDAGVGSCMTSFNDINGVPATANRWLLTDLLRGRWQFDGLVVSDYTSVNELRQHGLGDLQQVSALALRAGLQMDMVGEGFLGTLKNSLEADVISIEQIERACRAVLKAKHSLGLLEDPFRYCDAKRPAEDILSEDHRRVARDLAKRSFVLLKNHARTLPIKKKTKIALVGPLANDRNNMLGTWAPTGDVKLSVPVLSGVKNVAPNANVGYAKGANLTNDQSLAKKINVFGPRVVIEESSPEALLEEAISLAVESDVVVAVVGEASEMSGESSSRTDLSLPESQKKLINALVKTEKPIVLVLMSGRPLTISEELNLPVSILQVWHPGVEAGNAIADVLFGDYNPSGKLTATWPRNVGQIPIYYSTQVTGRPATGEAFEKFKSNYLDVPNSPLLPFGFGLSYTSFEYSDLLIDKNEITAAESIFVSVTVRNTGEFDGEEVVQLYLRDVVRSISPPRRRLSKFRKIFLPKGESETIRFKLSLEDLEFYDAALNLVSEPGEFEVFVGGSSDAQQKVGFVLRE